MMRAYRFPVVTDTRVPVTVVTGALGSGKTTLLGWLLGGLRGERIAVIENEFAKVGIDDALLGGAEVVNLNTGCLCCTARSDLLRSLDAILERWHGLDRILVETTGLAHPGPVLQALLAEPTVASRARLDAVVTLVDAQVVTGRPTVSWTAESAAQIAVADRLVVTKPDLVDAAELCGAQHELRRLNRDAPIVPAAHGAVDFDFVLGVDGARPDRLRTTDPDLLTRTRYRHDPAVRAVCLEPDVPLDPERVHAWLQVLLAQGSVLRAKGLLAVPGAAGPCVVQGVRGRVDRTVGARWPAGRPARSRVVVLGYRLDRRRLADGLRSCRT